MAIAVAQRYGGHSSSGHGGGYGGPSLHGGYSAPSASYGGGHHDDYVIINFIYIFFLGLYRKAIHKQLVITRNPEASKLSNVLNLENKRRNSTFMS